MAVLNLNTLRDVVGSRGEKIVELCLTDYQAFAGPLFKPGFLGEKWPAIDFYVELTDVQGKRPYFFIQTKSTSSVLPPTASHLGITSKKKDILRLLQLPGPTYLLGVHEPTRRVFARSVHMGMTARAITRIPLANELTSVNLRKLHDEVVAYWKTTPFKPTNSVFT